ncbi:MAG: c-type cytochrome [Verrucomicrobia bacterium]|jgi:cytochrome c oxidase cbb3-type subunit I/II|nr:c-type cytochrome [Verrucomicrobiota bacterium]
MSLVKIELRTRNWTLVYYQLIFCVLIIFLTQTKTSGEGFAPLESSVPPNRNLYFQGKHVYEVSCLPCHGRRGKGDGELVTQEWEVFPRDLSKGEFKYRSTAYGKLPTNGDLKRTILHGIAGSAMPTFHNMNEKDLSAVIEYIKYFSRKWRQEEAHGSALPLPVKPSDFDLSADHSKILQEGDQLFQQLCAPCHGPQAKGDGPASSSLEDSEGHPLPPANLLIPLGCGDSEEDMLRTIWTGMSATAMPSFAEALSPKEVWQIVLLISEWRSSTPP